MDVLSRLADLPREPAPDAAPREMPPPLAEDFDDFLRLFDELRGLVPASFFLMFKIARVLKTPEAQLTGQLKGFFDVCEQADRTAPTDKPEPSRLAEQVPILDDHNPQFGVRRIKGIEEIGAAMPGDVAIEDFTDLMRLAEERQLNVRVLMRDGSAEAGAQTAPIRESGARQMTNAAEQKLYILFDRSYSMWYRNRMLFAKVLAIEYLRRKKKTGARLFLRYFDFEVYDLERMATAAEIDALIRKLLYIEPGGKGTDINHALEVAARDIQFDGLLEKAEIMLITDGMDRIDPAHVREVLGEKTKLHVVKIGRDCAEPQQAEIKDMIEKDQSIAGLSRDQIAQHYQRQITTAWEQVAETLVETDDLDAKELDLGDAEIDFALQAVEQIVALPTGGLSLAESELQFRKASFVEGFIDMLLESAEDSEVIARRQADLKSAKQKLYDFKIRLAAVSSMVMNLLASKEIHFVTDKNLRKQAKKSNMTLEDLHRMQESGDLYLKLKLGRSGDAPPSGGEGLSLWKLLGMIAKSTARAMTGWLFKGEKEEAPDGEAPPAAEAAPEKPETEKK
ncbi:MAG: VWA domain-containing protein [Myxococcales bacterium]|nr:VWA domain-containing protein [Myxococcales bacterium]